MKIILQENIEKLGFADEVVNVKNGYARNFLIPKGKAVLATDSAIKILEEKIKQQSGKEEKIISDANKLAEVISSLDIKIKVKVADDGKKLFGSVSNIQFTDALVELGHSIDKRFVKGNNRKIIVKGNKQNTYTNHQGNKKVIVKKNRKNVIVKKPLRPNHIKRPFLKRKGFVWIPGFWQWTGFTYIWANGFWERQRIGYSWCEGYWEATPFGFFWVEGYWCEVY